MSLRGLDRVENERTLLVTPRLLATVLFIFILTYTGVGFVV